MRVPELPTFVIKDHYFLFKWAMSSEDLLQKKYDLFGQMRLIFMERTMCIDPRKKKKTIEGSELKMKCSILVRICIYPADG